MKQKRFFRALSMLCLTAALAVPLCGCAAAQSSPRPTAAAVAASDSRGYSSGETEIRAAIKEIRIEWCVRVRSTSIVSADGSVYTSGPPVSTGGAVEVQAWDGDAIVFSEQADRALDEVTALDYTVEGQTLQIRFVKDKEKLQEGAQLYKTLTLKVPRSLTLEELAVDTASADVTLQGISVREAEIDTASGNVSIKDAAVEELEIDTASGDVNLEPSAVGRLEVDTASGTVTGILPGAQKASIDTASGAVVLTVEDEIAELEADSTSGTLAITLRAVPGKSSFDSTSGYMTVTLPKDAVFGASVSWGKKGSYSGQFPTWSSSENGCMAGTSKTINMHIRVNSGRIALLAAE